jgi:hypothetical protein
LPGVTLLAAASIACVLGWLAALTIMRQAMRTTMAKYFSVKTFLAALVSAAPVLLHALVPSVSVDVFAAAAALVGAKLLHTDAKAAQ